ncbi:cysteine--tRNA ligase [Oenococcus oeni]|uniref:cysteine--tRNA ligase n=1 Tax=Oenococcus oeni TaxID=1247 RepID=UPI000277B7DC|nr:cysteine--tRNA ligase [Oenococcus oeni]KGO15943.1 cysteinyl-tRNA synthetase [Oenococcus oeni X2L]EJO03342.1 cysteinyl-tRNA synthetase [Oenococcus oeni AWRIB418]KEP87191.1 cysteinyl-tRNA synthetase [Oenococcus oeni IOEB_0501]KGH55544.1 cysteinyl-tRNA synthetase [Oenococcus oeni S22]KGH58665.1 cysteinyl-tRNA synthetase [Oenococcus oeni IOEB_9805]
MLKVFNTATLKKEEFKPIVPGKITMYVCGPTVYNYIHVGNARSSIAFDTIRRYLLYRGYDVNFVSNFTDVDDKIINRAQEEGVSENAIASKYIKAFYEDTKPLNIIPATTRTRATEVIPDIIEFVSDLIDKGYAYESQGDVYFRVRKAGNYGLLAHENLEDLEVGASGRLDDGALALKEDPLDFALWKNEPRQVIKWDSPWGQGRPGWHIECSVMSTKYLGYTIDIHGGGIDLAFPHHTDEMAQSEAHTGKQFVHYWLHNGFVNVNNEKMSKSLGNFTTVHELLSSYDDPMAIRFLMTATHYRRPINYSSSELERARVELDRIRTAYRRLKNADFKIGDDPQIDQLVSKQTAAFVEAMDDDFNVANALAAIFELVRLANSYVDSGDVKDKSAQEILRQIAELIGVFGISGLETKKESLPKKIELLLKKRETARINKNWQQSDQLRDEIFSLGYKVSDSSNGQQVRKI